ncbi:hypothetical protein AAF712_010264 [Marasmius tenuissimus]|uniref:Uncharacterized protein n=1 Tax=Marasmius tenuissimus TaxID=585030 RepID=A0ABR2ZQ57_9AGAR
MAISDAIIGAESVGVLVATALWGVTCMQTWWYFETYPNDPKYLKILVSSFPLVAYGLNKAESVRTGNRNVD